MIRRLLVAFSLALPLTLSLVTNALSQPDARKAYWGAVHSLMIKPPTTREELERVLGEFDFVHSALGWAVVDSEGGTVVNADISARTATVVYAPTGRPVMPSTVLSALLAKATMVALDGPDKLTFRVPSELGTALPGTGFDEVAVGIRDGVWTSTATAISWKR